MKGFTTFVICIVCWGGVLLPARGALKNEIPEIAQSRQLILVTTRDWSASAATVHCFERETVGGPWKEAFPACDAVTGRNGLAWGIGLHGTHPQSGAVKHEGDGRAPAGVFRLSEIFGYATPASARITKFPYQQLTATSAGVNDIHSRYYNRVVDSSRVTKDWKTAEVMLLPDGIYRWGIVVEHNWQALPGCGSCIFLHIWQGPHHGTSGCTAMAPTNLPPIIRWLDRAKNPVLVQLPEAEYHGLKTTWTLP